MSIWFIALCHIGYASPCSVKIMYFEREADNIHISLTTASLDYYFGSYCSTGGLGTQFSYIRGDCCSVTDFPNPALSWNFPFWDSASVSCDCPFLPTYFSNVRAFGFLCNVICHRDLRVDFSRFSFLFFTSWN